MKKTLFAVFLLSLGFASKAQKSTDVNIDYMMRAKIYASSSVEDSSALGGFGGSDNSPMKLKNDFKFMDNGFYLKIDTTKIITLGEKHNGYPFYIVNNSDSTVKLDAQDSRLYVTAEAFIDGNWQPIEYLPSSWCGNSYHNVYLNKKEYWEFQVPKFTGKLETKIRYKLYLSEKKSLYSNVIIAKINKKQLIKKEGHNSEGLMDPYLD